MHRAETRSLRTICRYGLGVDAAGNVLLPRFRRTTRPISLIFDMPICRTCCRAFADVRHRGFGASHEGRLQRTLGFKSLSTAGSGKFNLGPLCVVARFCGLRVWSLVLQRLSHR